ncbi:hypothetical protein CKO25_09150 [Thiocapsa imhoffii]|uniref:ATP-binding protein n=1 Tax=Thiocapsa imhoffii TaxID=382777 RepID=A0A9X0WIN3_9GAMM|nr:BREX system ATP-binding domain-containing protein [Thiocapsa imhoffii]MBK1644812.1 hypothetical protein [Thiocapsa imhoffii]
MSESSLSQVDALQLWAVLGSEGKATTDLGIARSSIPAYSVGVEAWLDRLAQTYLRQLCRKNAHFKVVIAPYGGGKTHFLMSLGTRALDEGFAAAYIACGPGASLDQPLDLYRQFVRQLRLPGEETAPGIRSLIREVVRFKRQQMQEHQVPNQEAAFDQWLRHVRDEPHPDNAFGRVMVEALKAAWNPELDVVGDAAIRWLQGDLETLTRDERQILRLGQIAANARADFGRNLLLSLVRFTREAGVHGVVLLFDEVETLFTARGKSLLRVLSAMRVLVDLPTGVPGGVPLFGVFSAVPDVLNELSRYPALQQRLAVVGASFDEGNDFAAQLLLERLDRQDHLLGAIGIRLIEVGEQALGIRFDQELQQANALRLADVAAERNLEVDARRLFVKTWVNLLNLQRNEGERAFGEAELAQRYQGFFDAVKSSDAEEDDEP